jgi:hypothetical protein
MSFEERPNVVLGTSSAGIRADESPFMASDHLAEVSKMVVVPITR